MNVLMFSPGFPDEMPAFTAGLAEAGATVVGLGDQPAEMLPERARDALAHYVRVDTLWDERALIDTVRELDRRFPLDRIECLWEPGVLLAAQLREALELPGLSVDQAHLFRDKELMKQRLDDHGIRTPHHASAKSESEVRAAAERIGYPLIVKPVAGAGSADTFRIDDQAALEDVLPKIRHVEELSVEEFIDGEEYTFDTICAAGRILYYNIAWYRPKPLIGRSLEWVSPQTVSLRRQEADELAVGREMGAAVIQALGFQTGFTHMEWFRTASGEAVFCEVAARPPGACSVDLMNFAGDVDTFKGWGEAVVDGALSGRWERPYNAAVIFKRAQGQGRIREIQGLQRIVARYRPHIVRVDLLPIGAQRRDWKATLRSDGNVVVRHPDLGATLEMADRVGTDLQMYAG
jgi:formate-dependent phosphoribosylglycinamide formyltransferase (GAR transformylase)